MRNLLPILVLCTRFHYTADALERDSSSISQSFSPSSLLDYLFPPQGPLLLGLLLNKIALLALCSDKQFTPL